MFEIAQAFGAVSSALLTPAIAVVTTYIAVRQHLDNRLKLNLDRYDRRLAVYKVVMQFLQNVASAAKVSIEDIRQLNLGTAEVSFLFGKDLTAYIDEIRKHGIALFAANAQYRDMNASLPTPPNYDHLATINSMHDELLWMHNQYDEATLKFGKYLRLS